MAYVLRMLKLRDEEILEVRADARYLALAHFNGSLVGCTSWSRLAAETSEALGELGNAPPVRLWGLTGKGWVELARHPRREAFEPLAPSELDRVLSHDTPLHETADGRLLASVILDDTGMGAIEVVDPLVDHEIVSRLTPVIAHRYGILATRYAEGDKLAPRQIGRAINVSRVLGEFAETAQRILEHDRLSVYLVVGDSFAFERFGSPPVVANEQTAIPFEDVGLRQVLITEDPIVSTDLGSDRRLLDSPQTRRVAHAGFKGMVSAPLRKDNRPFGVLSFTSRTPGFYREQDIPIVSQMADQVAVFIQNLRAQQRIFSALRYEAHEAERRRVTRSLYQTVAAAVPSINAAAASLESLASPESSEATVVANKIKTITDRVLIDMRRNINDILPPEIEPGDIEKSIAGKVARIRDAYSLDVQLEVKGDCRIPGEQIRRAVGHIAHEALLNAAQHASASGVNVSLEVDHDLKLTVKDDGKGFDRRTAQLNTGLGLSQIQALADSIGGLLKVASKPDVGTVVSLVLPGVFESGAGDGLPAIESDDPTPTPVLRVFVAASDTLALAGLRRMLERGDGLRVVGESDSQRGLAARLSQIKPDVLVTTTGLAVDDLDQLRVETGGSNQRTAVLLVRNGPSKPASELIDLGADGVIDVGSLEAELIPSVKAVADGITVVGSSCDLRETDVADVLSPRERHILELVANGETNAEIGSRLFLATKTVERHVATIVRKVNAKNRAHAAAIAAAQGLINLSSAA